ncbi:large terminase protein [uncultured Caudovirales phage]|uniref:Large terminase protein n=1 Tax=uncultured Caudovirales phage TaxID=2100421 RepID=A0A6J5MYP2_9CAUD|nr:large terminase protein [uncultured Caudovirales phage]
MATIKGYTPHEKQKLIHYSINQEHYKYYILNIGRQFGKTMLGINQMLYWAINHKGCNIAWVTPIYKQSKKVFDEMEKVTKSSGLFEYNRSDLTISGFNSQIQFFSGERPDNIRGNTFDYLIVDEMAFTRPELWSEVLSATVLVKGKKVIFISTPKGKNHFYQLSLQPNYDNRYKYFHYSSYDNPMIDAEDLEERKRSLPKHIFEQEYLAKFIDNASGLFKNVDSCVIKTAERTQKLFGGLDIGRADDYTVLTILNKNYQMVYVQRWRQQEWSKIIDEVATKIREYNAEIFVEVNNQGDVFFEMLQNKVYNNVQPYVTTTATKPIIIEDLAVHFENKDIGILNENWLVDELNAFTYIYNEKTRRVQYGAPQGIHDDGVMSLALAVQSIKKNQYGYFEVY